MLGVVANSDGRAEKLQSAVNIFISQGVDLVIHCGDVGGRHVLDALANVPAAFVWGDRDNDRTGLLRYAGSIGITCWGMLGELDEGGKKLVVVHGENRAILKRLINEQQYDFVLCGHELASEDQTVGRTRILNPGPLYGGSSAGSAMVLDPMDGKMKILPL
jgi:predicted phosphodiesterase